MIVIKEVYGVIYCATNVLNEKRYIGQTIRGLHRRKSEHIWYAKRGSDSSLPRAIRKYGEDNFEWAVIDEAYDSEELNKKEIKWIEYHNSFYDGYNDAIGGQCGVSEDPDEMSIMRGGRPFLVFDLDGNFITEVISQKQFAEDYDLNYCSVNFVLNHKKNSTQGYTMIFKDEFNETMLWDKIGKSQNREFYVFNKDELSFVGKWNDRKNCSKDINVGSNTITNKLNSNNYGNRCDYLFYFYQDIPEELKYKVKDVI